MGWRALPLMGLAFSALAACGGSEPDPHQISDLQRSEYCATALAMVAPVAHGELEGATVAAGSGGVVATTLQVLPGGYPRLQCGLTGPGDQVGAVTFDVTCNRDADLESGCVDPVSAVMGGRVVFESAETAKALRASARPRRHASR